MQRTIGFAILAVGIFLLIFGIISTSRVTEEVVQAVQGRYTDTTMWYIIGGIVLIVIGGGLSYRRR